MTAPKIALLIEPTLAQKVRYLPLAPSRPGEGERFQLSFQARFTNNEPGKVHVTKLRIRFPAASGVPQKDITIKTLHPDWTVSMGLDMNAGQVLAPMDFKNTDNIVLTSTPPATITFEVFAEGFSDPASYSFALARHDCPVPGDYAWMGLAHELRRGEYWNGVAAQHCCGPQLYAHDLGIVAFDAATGKWSDLLPGKDGSKNENYRIWGKPVHAMADGTVEQFDNNVESNPNPPNNLPNTPTYGSHFIVRHGDELMLYAHFQKGSLNSSLLSKGAIVKKGDFLGRCGNSGNSTNPHLHIHSIEVSTNMLRPIPWGQKMVAEREATRPTAGDWHSSQGQGLAVVSTLIYPGDVMPCDQREWSEWRSLGGELTSGPAVCSWGENRLDVFVIGTDKSLYHKLWNGSQWSGWESLGGQLTSNPAAVSWGPNRIDVFGRGTDNALWHKWWDGSKWHNWESLGGTLLSAPAVSSRRANHLDVFCEATDKSLYHRIWNGSQWTPWESLGGELTEDPAAVSWDDKRIDLFVRATDLTLYHKWWNGSTWSGWEPQSRKMKYGAAASSRRANHLDVFIVAPDGALQHRLWDGSQWTRWESIGGLLTADPAAVSWSSKRIDVFGRGTDNALYHTFWAPQS